MTETTVIKRSIIIGGEKTSVSLEDEFWFGFKTIASDREMTIGDLAGEIKGTKRGGLSSAIRVFVLKHYTGPMPEVRA